MLLYLSLTSVIEMTAYIRFLAHDFAAPKFGWLEVLVHTAGTAAWSGGRPSGHQGHPSSLPRLSEAGLTTEQVSIAGRHNGSFKCENLRR